MMRTLALTIVLFSLACDEAGELPDVSAEGEAGPLLQFKDGKLEIRAPGVNIDFDSDSGEATVDIDTNGVRVYADETGNVEIDAPGVFVENEGEAERAKAKKSPR